MRPRSIVGVMDQYHVIKKKIALPEYDPYPKRTAVGFLDLLNAYQDYLVTSKLMT